jgi:hypothetical protein
VEIDAPFPKSTPALAADGTSDFDPTLEKSTTSLGSSFEIVEPEKLVFTLTQRDGSGSRLPANMNLCLSTSTAPSKL